MVSVGLPRVLFRKSRSLLTNKPIMQSFSSSHKLLKEEKEKKEFPSIEIKEFQIKDGRYVSVKKYNEALYVDIREWYEKKDKPKKPSRKGIFLPEEVFRSLVQIAPQILEILDEAKKNLKPAEE